MSVYNFINSYQFLYVVIGTFLGICTACAIHFGRKSLDGDMPKPGKSRALSALFAFPCWFVVFVFVALVSMSWRILVIDQLGMNPLQAAVLFGAMFSMVQFRLLFHFRPDR